MTHAKTCARAECGRSFEARTVAAKFCRACGWQMRSRPRKYVSSEALERIITLRYAGKRTTPSIKEIAAQHGVPAWFVSKVAGRLGLNLRPQLRSWTRDDLAFLEEWAGRRSIAWLSKKLRRTRAAVALKLSRLQISRVVENGHTLNSVALCFGVSPHEVSRWVERGYLKGRHRHGGANGSAYAGDPWIFTDAALIAFVRDHPTVFRLGNVDPVWFIDLLLNREATGKKALRSIRKEEQCASNS